MDKKVGVTIDWLWKKQMSSLVKVELFFVICVHIFIWFVAFV